jgi:hypothetical protein
MKIPEPIKKEPIKAAAIGLIVVFIVSILFSASNWNGRLSLAFTAIASLSTVSTLFIAIKLYDRFGLKNQLVVKQAEKIFELFDLLLAQTVVAKATRAQWMIRANLEQLRSLPYIAIFADEADKKIFIAYENYEAFYINLKPIRQSYWLPREIQESLDFLMVAGTINLDFDPELHVKMTFSNNLPADEFNMVLPEITLGMFVAGLTNVIEQIDKWLKKHSEVEITLIPRY